LGFLDSPDIFIATLIPQPLSPVRDDIFIATLIPQPLSPDRDDIFIATLIPQPLSPVRDEIESLVWQTHLLRYICNLYLLSRIEFHWLDIDGLVKYILNQEKHHKKKTFREEYIELLQRFNLEYDVRYILKDIGE